MADLYLLVDAAIYITLAGCVLWFLKPKGAFGMGGGGTKTVVEENKMPEWLQDFAQENISRAKSVANRPYQQYTGERLADFTPTQQAAFDVTQQNVGAYQPALTAAQGATAENVGSTFDTAAAEQYMNPYTQQVTQRALDEVARQGNIARSDIGQQVAGAGGWGGARHGVIEAEQRRNEGQLMGDIALQGGAQSFDRALQAYQGDMGRQLQGANQLAQLGALGSQLGYSDAAALLDVGNRQQAQEQTGLDIGYTDFINQQQHPIEMLNLLLSAQSQTPYTTTRQQTGPGGSSTAGTLGGIGALAGGLGTLGSAAGLFGGGAAGIGSLGMIGSGMAL